MPADEDIVETAKKAGSFATLLAAARAAGLVEVLAGEGPYTIFAPTDEAFGKLPEGTVEELLKPENQERLARILRFHVISGRVYSDQAAVLEEAKTLAELPVSFTRGKRLAVNDATIVGADIDASNGVIHVIDAVLLPQE